MKSLKTYLFESKSSAEILLEGGNAGHMAHPIDFGEFTCQDLIDLVDDLFSARITGISEKLDGTNIQATMNNDGEVVFIRNKTDLNSLNGGMRIEDMANKWASNPSVCNNYLRAGEIITQVFNKIGKDWFNPDNNTKRIINCECISAGQTNIIPYISDQVDFHNIWVFKRGPIGWEQKVITKDGLDVLEKACADIDKAQITPRVTIKVVEKSKDLAEDYKKELNALFDKKTQTVEEWKKARFINWMKLEHPHLNGVDELFARFFLDDKSTNLRALKQMNSGLEEEVTELCNSGYKAAVSDCVEPLDKLFIRLGNDVIKLCQGLSNSGDDAARAVATLAQDLKTTIAEIRANGTDDSKAKLAKQIGRLVGGEENTVINPTEGIVFSYKGKLMKLTGSFGPLNQILGSIKFGR